MSRSSPADAGLARLRSNSSRADFARAAGSASRAGADWPRNAAARTIASIPAATTARASSRKPSYSSGQSRRPAVLTEDELVIAGLPRFRMPGLDHEYHAIVRKIISFIYVLGG